MKLLLINPPFTQLNTPYPATAYLKGFLNTKSIDSFQSDLGIEVILKLFSKKGLTNLFNEIENENIEFSANTDRIFALKEEYISTIDAVISFLQNKNQLLAHLICNDEYLPESSRFQELEELDLAFGNMGIHDKARYLATLYLEDISDLIIETIDPDFGFSRYAEQIALSAGSFDEIYAKLQQKTSFVDNILINLLEEKIEQENPEVVAISIPFPGNLLSALRCGQWLKKNKPEIKLIMGGGYANTELRSLSEKRIFEFADYITLDDGEAPLYHLLEHFEGKREAKNLKRCFALVDEKVVYYNASAESDYKQKDLGIPDYSDFVLGDFLSVIEIVNPMHRLWNDGRWNKLSLAHGCYWGQCTFCDVSLDYIKRYEPNTAKMLCDRVESMIEQTGETGFHFVDEAAPPTLMRAFALEVIRRRLNIAWWTNVRFEQNFTADLCILLKNSGCIAVSGGLEVASDRLLKKINKGVDIEQVARVTENFTAAGIMVHAYLMYGFPTQTEQETVDSLEVVRQLFETGIVQSAFWHKFSMTVHSPIGLNPKAFGVLSLQEKKGDFANNDLLHSDPEGCNHELFGEGLRKSLYNFMHNVGFDFDLQDWFDFPVPQTLIKPNRIEKALNYEQESVFDKTKRVVWIGNEPILRKYTKKKKGKTIEMTEFLIRNKKEDVLLNIRSNYATFVSNMLFNCSAFAENNIKLSELQINFESENLGDFSIFWQGYAVSKLRESALLIL